MQNAHFAQPYFTFERRDLMNTAMEQEELKKMLDQAVREATEQMAGVALYPGEEALGSEFCTVHISFNKGFHTSLSLCADTALLARMAQNVLEEETLSQEDLEEFGKEYLNILCGKVAAFLYRTTKVAARFSTPEFYHGCYTPDNQQTQFVLTYADEYQDSAQLSHHVPCPDTGTAE